MKNQFVIFDTEFTSWKGCMENGRAEWQKEEIVQIAALKVNEDLTVAEEFNVYVKPKINSVLSDYFIDLTGITNEHIAEYGVDFATAYQKFKVFSQGLDCYSYALRFDRKCLADGEIMEKNLVFSNIKDNNPPKYLNIAEWFKEKYAENDMEIIRINSGGIAKKLGVSEEIEQLGLDEHNALYDVYSLLMGVKYFCAKNLQIKKS